ncbi:MAG: (Fe-S)-binding protein [Planctomycetes bacterium]|nr:(Fe-S)-binding protein [Planctomycetota bacterium]
MNGSGWVITWVHGGLGLLTAVGFMGVLARFAGSRSFRVASGRMFYVDAVLIGVIAVSGLDLLLQILGILPAASGWESTIHITATMVWLLVSLFGDGFVSHAVGTVAYRFTNGHSPAALQIFSSACSRCGKCTEVCPEYEASNGLPEQAPALKVRHSLKQFQDSASPAERKAIVEHVYLCALCGLCVGVCPYAFQHYNLYMGLLRQVNREQEQDQEGKEVCA